MMHLNRGVTQFFITVVSRRITRAAAYGVDAIGGHSYLWDFFAPRFCQQSSLPTYLPTINESLTRKAASLAAQRFGQRVTLLFGERPDRKYRRWERPNTKLSRSPTFSDARFSWS